jgi:hypothetical protein
VQIKPSGYSERKSASSVAGVNDMGKGIRLHVGLNLIATSYAGRVRDFFRGHPKVAMATIIGVIVLASLIATLIWESQQECVRWATRINVTKTGGVYTTKVCAETRPRWGESVGK